MNGPENDRPLVALSAAEQLLALERLRGEVWQELTRLDSVMTGRDVALRLQATEYDRRLTALNHEAEQLKEMQAKYVSIDVYGRDYKENEARVRKLEGLAERMWVLSIVVGAIAAGIGAAVAKVLFP